MSCQNLDPHLASRAKWETAGLGVEVHPGNQNSNSCRVVGTRSGTGKHHLVAGLIFLVKYHTSMKPTMILETNICHQDNGWYWCGWSFKQPSSRTCNANFI
jgi:hypothetical protein